MKKDPILGHIFDIKHYALHDGPGIRTTVFLKGCPLRCQWCANPESQKAVPQIMADPTLCTGCMACVEACPSGAVTFSGNQRLYDRQACTGCGACTSACIHDALQLCGHTTDADTLWEQIRDERAFWDRSGGGVTLSGGEPLMQMAFASRFLDTCRSNRVHTAVETCGQVPEQDFARALELVDMVLFDVKLASAERHNDLTGVPNHLILKNLKTLGASGVDYLIRMPLIPTLNDMPQAIEQTGQTLARLVPGCAIELLPYHRLGEKKYDRLDRQYPLKEIKPPGSAQMEYARQTLAGFGLQVILPET